MLFSSSFCCSFFPTFSFVPFNIYYFHFSCPLLHTMLHSVFLHHWYHICPARIHLFDFFLFCFYLFCLTYLFFSYSPVFVFSIFHSAQYLHLVMQCKRTSELKEFYTNVLLLMAVLSYGFCSDNLHFYSTLFKCHKVRMRNSHFNTESKLKGNKIFQ